jgi:uncharacterized protein (TIGR03435 family)
MQTVRFAGFVSVPKAQGGVKQFLVRLVLRAAPFALLATVLSWLAIAQSNGPSFEVASVRPGVLLPPGPNGVVRTGSHGGPGTNDPETYSARYVTLASLILRAYGLRNYQLSGPGWMDSARYDIAAKVSAGATPAQFKVMLQNLLVDRFMLQVHYQKRDFSGYELSLAKGGLKLVDAVNLRNLSSPPKSGIAKATTEEGEGSINDLVVRQYIGRILTGRSTTMSNLADNLGFTLGDVPVVDVTGLTDPYDLVLPYDPPVAKLSDEPSSFPSLFTVLRAVGLNLEAKKVPLDVLVVDRIQQTPTEQ